MKDPRTPRPDKKFRKAQRELQKYQVHTNFPIRGMHLILRRVTGRWGHMAVKFFAVPNKIRQAPYTQSSPKINGVRMHWTPKGLQPRIKRA